MPDTERTVEETDNFTTAEFSEDRILGCREGTLISLFDESNNPEVIPCSVTSAEGDEFRNMSIGGGSVNLGAGPDEADGVESSRNRRKNEIEEVIIATFQCLSRKDGWLGCSGTTKLGEIRDLNIRLWRLIRANEVFIEQEIAEGATDRADRIFQAISNRVEALIAKNGENATLEYCRTNQADPSRTINIKPNPTLNFPAPELDMKFKTMMAMQIGEALIKSVGVGVGLTTLLGWIPATNNNLKFTIGAIGFLSGFVFWIGSDLFSGLNRATRHRADGQVEVLSQKRADVSMRLRQGSGPEKVEADELVERGSDEEKKIDDLIEALLKGRQQRASQ